MVGDGGVTSNGGGLRGDGEAQRRQRSGEGEGERKRERERERQGRAWKELSGAAFGELVYTSGPDVTWYFL